MSGLNNLPKLKPEDLFLTIDTSAFPELSDETMRRLVEQVQPIVDAYFRNAEQMAQRCFIEPSNALDVARKDTERELLTTVAPDKLEW